MEQIIKKAIEGGWRYDGKIPAYDKLLDRWFLTDGDGGWAGIIEQMLVCSSLFWQALGKARSWPEKYEWSEEGRDNSGDSIEKEQVSWVYHSLNFHEINLTAGWEPAVTYLRSVCGIEK